MENSKIGWTDNTFNPWIGCTRVSSGCIHCYAETLMDKRLGKAEWGPTGIRQRTSEDYWKQPLKWNRAAKESGKSIRVFCASLADVFERNDQIREWRWDLWDLVTSTPNLTWMFLTKRPENVLDMVPWYWYRKVGKDGFLSDSVAHLWPANVWIGASVEDRENADKRIPHLLNIPAPVRFLSIEPMLGPIHIQRRVDWVIVGGESGLGCRPMNIEWARDILIQCQAAGIPFFMKQLGGHPDKREGISRFPPELQVRQFPTCPEHGFEIPCFSCDMIAKGVM